MTEPPPTESRHDLFDEIAELIKRLEGHADPAVAEATTALLERIDAVHRTALTHLVAAINGMAGEAFLNRLTGDPAIRLLLMSYDLVAVDRRLHAEEALDAVRGHLHSHGIDVELTEVVGGVVYVRLHGLSASDMRLEQVRHDLEAALRDGFVGFQQLEFKDRGGSPTGGLVTLGGLSRAKRPVHRPACTADAVPPGTMHPVEIDEVPILIVHWEGEFHAVHDRCGDSPLPLHFGTLENGEVRCSWHGCRYDVRTGHGRQAEAERIPIFPVAVKDGQVLVALGVEPAGG